MNISVYDCLCSNVTDNTSCNLHCLRIGNYTGMPLIGIILFVALLIVLIDLFIRSQRKRRRRKMNENETEVEYTQLKTEEENRLEEVKQKLTDELNFIKSQNEAMDDIVSIQKQIKREKRKRNIVFKIIIKIIENIKKLSEKFGKFKINKDWYKL